MASQSVCAAGEPREVVRVALVFVRPQLAFAHGDTGAPPLGLLSLAAYVRLARPDQFSFHLLDTYYLDDATLRGELKRLSPAVVGLSTLSAWWDRLAPIAELTREVCGPATRIVAGGPHATAYPDQVLDIPEVDGVIAGEGEVAFVDYLDHVVGRIGVDEVRGLLHCQGGAVVRNAPAPQIRNLDDLPMPAYDLIDLSQIEQAHPTIGLIPPPHRYLPIVTSRGCVFDCAFCHHSFGRGWRAQSATRVVDDLEQLVRRHGLRNIDIVDDIFNANPKRTMAICRGIIERKLDVRIFFPNGLRFDMLDRPLLEALRTAGSVFMSAAFEAAAPRLQREMKKFVDIEKTMENVAIADQLGIFVKGFFILGSPGETREEIELTIRTAEASRLHFAHFFLMRPLRGTALGDKLASQGIDVSPQRLGNYMRRQVNFSDLPDREFKDLVSLAYRRFWTPRRVLGAIARHPAPHNVLRGAARPVVLRRILELVRETLSMPAGAPDTRAAIASPAFLPPVLEQALVSLGMAGRDWAVRLHERLPRDPVVPADLRGRVGVTRARGAANTPTT